MKTYSRLGLGLLALIVLGAGGYAAWRGFSGAADAPKFKTGKVERGPLTAVVSATGTLNPRSNGFDGSEDVARR